MRKTVPELIQEARTLATCMLPDMPDYGASSYAVKLLPELADALAEMDTRLKKSQDSEHPWRYAQPGEIWALGIGGGYHGDSIATVSTPEGVRFVWGVKGGEIRNIPVNDRSIDYGQRVYPQG